MKTKCEAWELGIIVHYWILDWKGETIFHHYDSLSRGIIITGAKLERGPSVILHQQNYAHDIIYRMMKMSLFGNILVRICEEIEKKNMPVCR